MTLTLESLAAYTLSTQAHSAKEAPPRYSNGNATAAAPAITPKPSTLLSNFLDAFKETQSYRKGNVILVDGRTLSIPAVTAAARYNASVAVDSSAEARDRLRKSRDVIVNKMAMGKSVYGVSTGYGGSADTRTDDPLRLGSALLQHQHSGVISTGASDVLPLLDPLSSTSMPESWVRGAILIRMNSLIRGHSGVRLELIEQMASLLQAQITPLVPLRGSISASGDLSPLSYIAGTLIGNPSIRTICKSPFSNVRRILPSNQALAQHNIEPISLQSKEHLGILNGTAFSASVAALALNDATHLALLAQILTAMGAESLFGTQASFAPFIHVECRPHPGQVEVADTIFNLLEGSTFASSGHEEEMHIDEDKGHLRQDRYPLRTSPQFLGPQVEDILSALATVTIECNSTTDNPLIDGNTKTIFHGGNFQAMAVTNAMESTRLALHHIGKLLFAQATELMNPAMNNGLPHNLAASNPSLNYHVKGIDIAMAAYVSELGFLASPVSTHIQSAENHNQAVNSLALISGRATINALDTLSILMSSYLYILCQALDLRSMQAEFLVGLSEILREELASHFGSSSVSQLHAKCLSAIQTSLDSTSVMDSTDKMNALADSCTLPLVNNFTSSFTTANTSAIHAIPAFRQSLSARSGDLHNALRKAYLYGARGPAPAGKYLNKTRKVYEYVRKDLGIKMHGKENFESFNHVGIDGVIGMPGGDDGTLGEHITRIYEAIRDGELQAVVADTFA